MAICRPGMPSKAKRAATSLMRVAPLVITTNWMMTMIAKMMMPTTILPLPAAPPVTNSPNVLTTPPAADSPSLPALGENQPRRGHVQHQPEQRRRQQQRGENAEFQRRADVDRREQHDHGDGDVARQAQVHQRRGQRHHDHQNAGDDAHRQDEVLQSGTTVSWPVAVRRQKPSVSPDATGSEEHRCGARLKHAPGTRTYKREGESSQKRRNCLVRFCLFPSRGGYP